MGVKIITPPDLTAVVAIADLRTHLRLAADGTQDELASVYLAAAHAQAEHYTGRAIGTQVRELALDVFPRASIGDSLLSDAIELGSAVTSVVSVTYIDTAGATQTLASSAYTFDDYGLDAWLVRAYGTAWPKTLETVNAVKVRYNVGDVLPAVKPALLTLTTWLFDNRGSELGDMPEGVCNLLNTVKRWPA